MSFTYKNLWTTLERYNMSKTDLRQKLGLSTATLAKLSSDQSVALDVLDKICEELGCSLNDVITHQTDTVTVAPWSVITTENTYLINLYFYHTSEQTAYIYGFATPYQMTEEGMNFWHLSPSKTNSSFYILQGYISGANLLSMLQAAENNKTIGQLLNDVNVCLSGCTEIEQDAISSLFICNGSFTHRPKYLLSTQEECAGLLPQLMPHQSFESSAMYCESLSGLNKASLYSSNGNPDSGKLHALWQVIKEELPVHSNLNELSRINNFEVFSPLLSGIDTEKVVTWKIDCREENGKKIPEAISVHLDHHFLHGSYAVNVCAYNTKNVFLNHTKLVYCGEEDITLRLPLQESISHATIQVWQMDNHSPDTNLIYSSTHSLMRHLHLDMHLSTRTFQIEDAWTRKMEKNHIPVDKKGEFYSHHPVSITDPSEESWVSEEESVQKDAHRLLGTYHPQHIKGIFLREGSEKHIQFLSWFKKLLTGSNIHRVILIDPFITAESISQLLRSVSNTGIMYEIVTNFSHDDRIAAIQQMEHFLDVIHPGKLKIHAIATSKPFLHDRYLILLGEDQLPVVYVLSNSFDNLAEHHSSVVLPTDNALAQAVLDYYLEVLSGLQDNGQLELLYDSQKDTSKKTEASSLTVTSLPQCFTLEEFCHQLTADFPTALASLASMQPEVKQDCINYIMTLEDDSIAQKLIDLLQKYLLPSKDNVPNHEDSLLLSAAQLLLQHFDSHGELLGHASQLSDWCFEYDRNHCGWDIYFSLRLLWKKNPSLYCSYLSTLKEQLDADRSFSNHRIFRLAASMLGHLAASLALNDAFEQDLSVLFSSDLPILRAVAIAKVLFLPPNEQLTDTLLASQFRHLNATLTPQELLWSEIYQIKELQIRICQRPNEHEKIQPLINLIIEHAVDTILSIAPVSSENSCFSNEDLYQALLLLYFRNSEDICRIVLKLHQKNYYSKTTTTQLLIRLFFEKYKKGFSNSDEFFAESDLQESCMILNYMKQIDTASIAQLKKELSKLERQLRARLYNAFLKTKNYRLWKSSVDLLCCLVFIELWLAKHYHLAPSPAVKEFQRISENFRATLEKYSEVYKVLVYYFPEMED